MLEPIIIKILLKKSLVKNGNFEFAIFSVIINLGYSSKNLTFMNQSWHVYRILA